MLIHLTKLLTITTSARAVGESYKGKKAEKWHFQLRRKQEKAQEEKTKKYELS